MSLAIITGAAGLVGSELALHYHALGYEVWGIDNDMRKLLFGSDASTQWMRCRLEKSLPHYQHFDTDIRNTSEIKNLFTRGGKSISVVIHAAAQPSHDWAARDPMTDFEINANGTLNVLEATRKSATDAPFIFISTNKVYGDSPNGLPLVELEDRFELPVDHPWFNGIPVEMSIDQSTHSIFGVSKSAADLMVQEYGRYFGMSTICFRCGCLTGSGHSATELHGFLAYLVKCSVTGHPYTVFGYDGKQVRDNIHASDLVSAVDLFLQSPFPGAVYNIGGGRENNCSMREAINLCENITGTTLNWSYDPEHRIGDHKWWISDLNPFKADFPKWELQYDLDSILQELYENNVERWNAKTI